jgi:hypothetical protein
MMRILIEIRFIKFSLTSIAYQTKSSPLEGLARPRALPRPPPYGAVERSARAWSPALQTEDDEEDDRNEEADQYDSDEETTRIFLQQPGAGATVRTMQPTFPPAPEFRPPTMVADPASAVRALDRVPWDDLITPANLTTMREADRRGRPLAGPEPTANPVAQTPKLRPGH